MSPRRRQQEAAARKFVLELLGIALVEIRGTSYAGAHMFEVGELSDRDRINLLTNMFHNVPQQLESAAHGATTHLEIVELLWKCNRDRPGGQVWLRAAAAFAGESPDSPLLVGWA